MLFHFHEPGLLLDRELQLVPPHRAHIDELLLATTHPATRQLMPRESAVSRRDIELLIDAWPEGRQPGRWADGTVPTYHFWMRITGPEAERQVGAPGVIAGAIGLRIGSSQDLELYYGHIGYHVYPPCRGHHYAERSCRLLFGLARSHGISPLWITCNPDNTPSLRTCQRLGGRLVDTVDVPPNHPLALRGEVRKCRFCIEI